MSQNVQFDSYLEARLQAAPLLLEILGLASKHGLGRRACVLLVLSAQPQKPHFDTTLGKGHLSVIVDNVFSTSLQTHHQHYKNQNREHC